MATIVPQKKITQFYDYPANVQVVKISIPTAEVLTLSTAPIEIVPAESEYIFDVISVSGGVETFVSAAYDTNVNLRVYTNGMATPQFESDQILASPAERIVKAEPAYVALVTEMQLQRNAAIYVDVETGNPATGDSDIVLYVSYMRIKVM